MTFEAEAAMLQALVNLGLTLRLFGNDRTPARGDRAKSYTEVAFPGYKPIRLAGSVWTVRAGQEGRPTEATAPFQLFQRTKTGAAVNVYGWYLTAPDGAVVAAGRVGETPFDVVRAREAVEIQATLTFKE